MNPTAGNEDSNSIREESQAKRLRRREFTEDDDRSCGERHDGRACPSDQTPANGNYDPTSVSTSSTAPPGLWFHRLGPNPANRLPVTQLNQFMKPPTTPLDLSKLGPDGRVCVVPVAKKIAVHLMTASNKQLLAEMSGAIAAWEPDSSKVSLRGSADQINMANRLLLRIMMHCQWGVSEEKVQRLLKPRRVHKTLVRLAPMGLQLKSIEKTLSMRSPRLSIGKDKTNDAVIMDALVSRHHCVLELDTARGAVYAIDCSTNGSFLNGKRLPQKKHGKVLLSHGDELLLRDPGQDSEFGYMVNLVIDSAHVGSQAEEDTDSIGREWAELLHRRRSQGAV